MLLMYRVACTLIAYLGTLGVSDSWAEKRIALVIGNGKYVHTPILPNPPRDARAIATALMQLNFDVMIGIDQGKLEWDKLVRAFSAKLDGADVALFFFAGHGLQLDGQNYLLPTDASLKSARDVDIEAFSLARFQKMIEIDRTGKTNIIILDACRDNPFIENLSSATRSYSTRYRGLAALPAGAGTFIAYSTQPGNTASDGTEEHSPFATALLRHIDKPGKDLSGLMIQVRRDVVKATNGKQLPWDHSALVNPFFFTTPKVANSEKTAVNTDILKQQMMTLISLRQAQESRLAFVASDMDRERDRSTKKAMFAEYQSIEMEIESIDRQLDDLKKKLEIAGD